MVRIITVTTDFGQKDSYVGALKGALLSVNPNAVIVDICNDISPGAIQEAAFILSGAYASFPPGSIHLGVVDPGVGSGRRAIIVETAKHTFVGPDNGLFSFALSRESIVKRVNITKSGYFNNPVSPTFHGRDIFAPVAGHLSLGVEAEAFGTVADSIVTLPVSLPLFKGGELSGTVIHIDGFGNIITSIKEPDMLLYFPGAQASQLTVETGSVKVKGLSATYSDTKEGSGVALIGSSGYLEVALNGGSCAASFNVKVGEKVRVTGERGE